jgi:hypothetical protein
MTFYTIEPPTPLSVEEPRTAFSVSAPAAFEIAQSQLHEAQRRLAHHRANPNERRYNLDEVEAFSTLGA